MAKKEVDLSEFASPARKGPPCFAGTALGKLQGESLEKILAALDSPEIQGSMIALRLSEWSGIKVAGQTLARHRRGECKCG